MVPRPGHPHTYGPTWDMFLYWPVQKQGLDPGSVNRVSLLGLAFWVLWFWLSLKVHVIQDNDWKGPTIYCHIPKVSASLWDLETDALVMGFAFVAESRRMALSALHCLLASQMGHSPSSPPPCAQYGLPCGHSHSLQRALWGRHFHLLGGSWGWKIPRGMATSQALPSSVLVGPAQTPTAHLGSAHHISKGP